jgi:hypothetical protein
VIVGAPGRGALAGVPGTASTGVAGVLGGASRPLTVLAVFPRALYATHRDGLLAIESADGAGLPNGVTVSSRSDRRPFTGIRVATTGTVGGGAIVVGDLTIRVVRWRRARPVLGPTTPGVLRRAATDAGGELARHAPPLPPDLADPLRAVGDAVAAGDADTAIAAARRGLLGRGPGLTPSGDDVLAGLVAGASSLAAALTPPADLLGRTVASLGSALADAASEATTAISAALLDHAARGEVAAPAARLLAALAGHGHVAPAVDGLLQLGSSSGRDLTAGLLAAAELVTATATLPRRAH